MCSPLFGVAVALVAGALAVPMCHAGESVPAGYASAPRAHGIPAGYFYASREEAHRALQGFLSQGKRSIDIGLMQVNWHWHRDKLGDPWQALDPVHNLQVGARILATCYRERRDRWDAVGCYHAPNNRKFARRYRRNVAAHWQRIAQRG